MIRFFFLFFILFFETIYCENGTIVTTPAGKIKGLLMESILGNKFHAFRGIPFAEAPIGDLRYEPPIPAAKFVDVFNAQQEGPACYQHDESWPSSEDCLRLNVYTKDIPVETDIQKKAVIVYIHPGGFHSLTGRSDFAGPHYLLDQDIVLVSINYRLGSLGFLNTNDKVAPGNNGLKDQVLALKWVKDNIASFGGDPDNVTVFGYSAGSVSVLYHLVSPMSKGLFHKAIAMSGSWTPPTNNYYYTENQATRAGCPKNSSELMLSCLRQMNASYITQHHETMFEFLDFPVISWGPVIEKDFGQERFLTDEPNKLIRQTDLSDIPIMIGISEYEYVNPAYAIMDHDKLLKKVNEEWDQIAPIVFHYEKNTSRSQFISKKLKEFYLNSQDLKHDDDESLIRMRDLCSDGIIGFPMHRSVDCLAVNQKNRIYNYRFSFSGKYGFLDIMNHTKHDIPSGPTHNDELIYIFSMQAFFEKPFTTEDKEYPIVYKMTKMWTNFAKFGNPTPENDKKLDDIVWPLYDKNEKFYLDIGEKFKIEKCLYCDRYKIWDELFPMD